MKEEINYQTKKEIYPWSHSKVVAKLGLELWYPSDCALKPMNVMCQRNQTWVAMWATDWVRWLTLQLLSWPDLVSCGWLMPYHLGKYLKAWGLVSKVWGPLERLEDLRYQLNYPSMTSSVIISSMNASPFTPPRHDYTFLSDSIGLWYVYHRDTFPNLLYNQGCQV